MWLLQTSTKAKPKKRAPRAVLVEIKKLYPGSKQLRISAMGIVKPAQEVEIKSKVSGTLLSIGDNVIPGGFVQENEVLFQLDPVDLKISARQLSSELKKAKSNLELEKGNQRVSKKEYELLGETVQPEERALILRQPQLKNLTAALEIVQAKLESAELDIKRTTIRAPFNGVIQSRYVDVGSQIGIATPLSHLVGTDEFWVEVTLPVNKLQWLELPIGNSDQGSIAIIKSGFERSESTSREGRVIRLAPDLEEKGRMAKLLVSVKAPLSQQRDGYKIPLLLGSFVQVEILGTYLDDVVILERKYLRDGEHVWILNEDNRLTIRKVEIVYKDRDLVCLRKIQKGERVIVSDLPVAVEGMELQVRRSDLKGMRKKESQMRPGLRKEK